MPSDQLILIGGTMAMLLAVTGIVLTRRNAWRAILIIAALLTTLNFGVFLWAELLIGRMSFQLFLFWLTAFMPPLLGLAIGAGLGYLFDFRTKDIAKEVKPDDELA